MSKIHELTFKEDTTVGFYFKFKAGETIYFEDGNYNDNFMEYTYIIYKKNENGLVYVGTIRSSCLPSAKENYAN